MNLSKRRKLVMARLKSRAKKYSATTSLHGFQYIVDPESTKFKSYFWMFVCLISTGLCILLIHSQFRSYYSNRIATTISTTAHPIWEVPFPAVTLCNYNVVYKDNMDEIRMLLENQQISSADIDNFFSNLSSLILSKADKDNIDWDQYRPITKILTRKGYSTEKLMRTLAQPCNQLLNACYWNMKELNCSDIFHSSKTNAGFCCSFNYKGVKNEPENQNEDIYVTGVGPTFGLYVHLNTEEEQYVSSFKRSPGIDVTIHETTEYPDMMIYSTTIHPGSDVSLSVKPQITQCEASVREIDIDTRKCAFEDEVKMTWAPSYSYNTCINECKAKAIMELCDCIPFYYPVESTWLPSFIKYSNNFLGRVRFCTLPDMACLKKNNVNFKGTRIITHSSFQEKSKKASGDIMSCRCYPQCNEISYSYQLDLQPLKDPDAPAKNDSILRVYFGNVSCTKLLRSVFITWELILASVGGLIGLCLGGSILSVIEFFYHLFETIFSRYKSQTVVKPAAQKLYKPKLYLSDFHKFGTLQLLEDPTKGTKVRKSN